jgi:hypothetical protein
VKEHYGESDKNKLLKDEILNHRNNYAQDNFFLKARATFTRSIKTGTSTNGPITVAITT